MIANFHSNNYWNKNQKNQDNLKNGLLKFFLVFHPIKPFQSVNLIVIMGLFLSLKLVLAKLSISLPGFGTRISLVWTSVMIAGWFLGPVYGLIFGIVADTVGFLFAPGVWYWAYALQEPSVGLVGGLMGSWLRAFQNKFQLKTHLIINQIFIAVFVISVIAGLMFWTFKAEASSYKKIDHNIKYLAIGLLLLYTSISELAIIYFYWKKKRFLITYLYASIVVISLILFWSFLLGPVIAINYYHYRTGRIPDVIKKYGPIIYLVPRMIREAIKTPIQIILMTSIIIAINPVFENVYNTLQNPNSLLNRKKMRLTHYSRYRTSWKKRFLRYFNFSPIS